MITKEMRQTMLLSCAVLHFVSIKLELQRRLSTYKKTLLGNAENFVSKPNQLQSRANYLEYRCSKRNNINFQTRQICNQPNHYLIISNFGIKQLLKIDSKGEFKKQYNDPTKQISLSCNQQIAEFEKAIDFKYFFPQYNLHAKYINKNAKCIYQFFNHEIKNRTSVRIREALNQMKYFINIILIKIIWILKLKSLFVEIMRRVQWTKDQEDLFRFGIKQIDFEHQIFDDDEEIIDFEADPNLVKQINYYYQLHEYDQVNKYTKQTQISFVDKIEDSNIEHLMDQKSIDYLKYLGFEYDELSKDRVSEWLTKITPLLGECYRLNCVEIIEILKISVAIFFYIEGLTEKEFQQFALKWGIQYPLPPQRQRKIVEENKFIFERQGKK